MAEWTALPFDLSSWHSRHLAESTFFSSGTGCVLADAGKTVSTRTMAAISGRRGRARRKVAFGFSRAQFGSFGTIGNLCICTGLAFVDGKRCRGGMGCKFLQQSSFGHLRKVWRISTETTLLARMGLLPHSHW